MSRAKSQPVRIADAVIQRLKIKAAEAGRTLPAEVEQRLKESLERDAWAEVEQRMTPRAGALGRLVGFLAHELAAYSPPGQDKEYVRQGIGRLLERLEAPTEKEPPAKGDAAMMVDYWLLRMANAYERTSEQGALMPVAAEQTVLAQIRESLIPSANAASTSSSKESQ